MKGVSLTGKWEELEEAVCQIFVNITGSYYDSLSSSHFS